MFSESQMRKAKAQCKSSNTFLCLSPDREFDTLKAQILQKIDEKLNPGMLTYDDYMIEWTIPRIQPSAMSLSSPADYNNEDDSRDGIGGPEDSNTSDSDCEHVKKKKKSKKHKKGKGVIENIAINEKIQNLQNCWMCSKPGCSSDHCFVHPEHPDHFSLGHEHLSVWAAAWVPFYIIN
ncbi:hypothetical protein PAXRUDRAFT_32073 [Paxillus rubicundulus Ve08.2h10]|uniref:Uncharacterized protein n=1 Tax=Paxillus rubicundulus Ve08.2h10 TaxID=930991 RepID=A0A0D0DT85_9AGAM|nr:hypothetical protein PAXRUDRAFT_32073 [Paxillus rubicundulus Ve08.2h10]